MLGAPVENKLPELEVKCDRCNGDGGESMRDGSVVYCTKCNGAKYIPTECGIEILALLMHNIKLSIHDSLTIECRQDDLLSKRQRT